MSRLYALLWRLRRHTRSLRYRATHGGRAWRYVPPTPEELAEHRRIMSLPISRPDFFVRMGTQDQAVTESQFTPTKEADRG